jgi:hypothetical protein
MLEQRQELVDHESFVVTVAGGPPQHQADVLELGDGRGPRDVVDLGSIL